MKVNKCIWPVKLNFECILDGWIMGKKICLKIYVGRMRFVHAWNKEASFFLGCFQRLLLAPSYIQSYCICICMIVVLENQSIEKEREREGSRCRTCYHICTQDGRWIRPLNLSEEQRVVVIRFGHDWDDTCMQVLSLSLSLYHFPSIPSRSTIITSNM